MANHRKIVGFDLIQTGLKQIEALFRQHEADAALGRQVRELTGGGKPSSPPKARTNGKAPKQTKAKGRPKKIDKTALATKVLEVLRDKKEGLLSKEMGPAVGASGDALYQVLKSLRDEKKIIGRGATSKMRYFLT